MSAIVSVWTAERRKCLNINFANVCWVSLFYRWAELALVETLRFFLVLAKLVFICDEDVRTAVQNFKVQRHSELCCDLVQSCPFLYVDIFSSDAFWQMENALVGLGEGAALLESAEKLCREM